ncbi:MAG: outer membrane protein assembly factor BamA [Candidatus Eisenbacteria bacterium]|nr:outer membrane protein assembly factor BamA [Candidatus Eisenbacteria bacterium]
MRVTGVLLLVVLTTTAVALCASVTAAQVVSGLTTEGNEYLSRDRILLGFGVRVGDELSADSVREGIRRLYDMGHFSDILVEAEQQDDGSVRLVIVVEERPKVQSINIEGNDRVSKKDIESVLRVEVGAPYTASRLEDSRVSIEDLYEHKGFTYAKVATEVKELTGNTVGVTISVEEEIRVLVKEIRFSGNESIETSDLKKVMETKEDRWWRTNAYFDRGVLDEDLVRIVSRYREEGYIDAVALGYDTKFDEKGERVTVTITVDEGGLYTVSAVEWVGVSDFAVKALHKLTELDVGDIYEPPLADETIRAAYDWYGERGYIHARVVSMEDVEDDQQLRLQFVVDEANPAHVGEIHIAGNTQTKEKVIRRELLVNPGDLYQTSQVIASQRKIANLGFFNGPMVEFTESDNPDDIDLVFTVEERQTGKAGVGVSHTSEKGPTGFIEWTQGNLFGNGQYLDFKWEFSKNSTEVVLGFTEPWFMDRRLILGFDLYDTDYERTYEDFGDAFYEQMFSKDDYERIEALNDSIISRDFSIKRERRGGDVSLGMPLLGSVNTTVYTKYTLEQFRSTEEVEIAYRSRVDADTNGIPDADTLGNVFYVRRDARFERFEPEWKWRSGFTGTLVRRTTDRRFHPQLGSYTRLTADLFGGVFGGSYDYQRYILDTRTYIPAMWTTTLMLRARGGVVTGYGDPGTVPEDTRFELGGVGVNGVRGYDNRSILRKGNEFYGGRTMLVGSAELSFPLNDERSQLPLHGLFFVDAGNTWESMAVTHPSELYWGVGAGIRIDVPMLGNIGVDFGYGLNYLDESNGKDWAVHYQFGTDF